MIDVNLNGVFHTTQAVLPDMVEEDGDASSTSRRRARTPGSRSWPHYVAAKSAVNGLTKSLALEYGPRGITVNAVPPGFVDTPMLRSAEKAASARRHRRRPHQTHTGAPGRAGPRTSPPRARSSCPRRPATSPARSSASTAAVTPDRSLDRTSSHEEMYDQGPAIHRREVVRPEFRRRHHGGIAAQRERSSATRPARDPPMSTARSRPLARRSTPDRGRGMQPRRADRGDHSAGRHLQGAASRHGGADYRPRSAPPSLSPRRHRSRLPLDDDLGVLRYGGELRLASRHVRAVRQGHSDVKQPVGVVAAVVPWNMPQFLTVTKVVPALLAGCSVVLKPAPESVLERAAACGSGRRGGPYRPGC